MATGPVCSASGVVNVMRALLPCWPRFVPVKFTVVPALRLRLAKVRSIEAMVDTLGVAVMVFAPWTELNAPKASLAALSTLPVTEMVPVRSEIAMASPMRLLFCVWVLVLLLSESTAPPLIAKPPVLLRMLPSFSSVVVPPMRVVEPV